MPMLMISGSVKQMAAIALGANSRFCPAISSATISPWVVALCSNIGSPTMSPIAQTLRMLVLHLLSIFMNFLSSVKSTPMLASPQPDRLACRPIVTNILSLTTLMTSPSFDLISSSCLSFKPRAREFRYISTLYFFRLAIIGQTNSLSKFGKIAAPASINVTLLPNLA